MWFVNMNEAGQDAGILRSVSESWVLTACTSVYPEASCYFTQENEQKSVKENFVMGNVKCFL